MSDEHGSTGRIIGGCYRLDELIGSGGMGQVYRALDLEKDSQVAVKLLRVRAPETVAKRFEREIHIMKSLMHVNIVGIHDVGSTDDGRPYYTMDLLEGETLAARLERDRLEADQWLEVLDQICAGLAVAHQRGIVHRDLKPANIFLTDEDLGDGSVKLLDFGVAKVIGRASNTKTAEVVGTPQYMAPEQARAEQSKVSPSTDVFSVGAIAYEMICGVRPFSGSSTPDIIHEILHAEPAPLSERSRCSLAISDAIERALSKDPRDRFASASELRAALKGGEAGRRASRPSDGAPTIRARPATLPTKSKTSRAGSSPPARSKTTTKPGRSHARRIPWGIMLFVALALAAGVTATLTIGRGDPLAPTRKPRLEVTTTLELGNLGLEAKLARDTGGAATLLARAYAAGDQRLGVRIALRRSLAAASAWRGDVDHGQAVAIAIAPRGDELVIASPSELVRYTTEGAKLDNYRGTFTHVAYSPDGGYLAASGSNAIIIDRRTNEVLESKLEGDLDFTPHGELVIYHEATETDLAVVETRALPSLDSIARRSCPAIGPALFTRSGDRIALVCANQVSIFAAATPTAAKRTMLDSAPSHAMLTSTGEHLILSGDDATHVLAVAQNRLRRLGSRNVDAVVGGGLGSIALRSRDTWVLHQADFDIGLPIMRSFDDKRQKAAVFTASGLFVVGNDNGDIVVYDGRSGFELLTIAAHGSAIETLAVAGDLVASTSLGTTRLWQLDPRTLLDTVIPIDDRGRKATIRRTPLLLSNDRLLLVHDEHRELLDLDSGRKTRVAPLGGKVVKASDGSVFTIGNKIYDGRTGALRTTLPEGEISVLGIDARAVAYAEPDMILRRVGNDDAKGDYERVISEDDRAFSSIDLSDDGDHYLVVVRSGLKGRVELTAIDTGALVAEHRSDAQRAFFVGESSIIVESRDLRQKLWNWRRGSLVEIRNRVLYRQGSLASLVIASVAGIEHIHHLEDGRLIGRGDVECQGFLRSLSESAIASNECGAAGEIWDPVNELTVLRIVEPGDDPWPTELIVDPRGRFAIATSFRGVLKLDLTPESRSPTAVLDLSARLVARTSPD